MKTTTSHIQNKNIHTLRGDTYTTTWWSTTKKLWTTFFFSFKKKNQNKLPRIGRRNWFYVISGTNVSLDWMATFHLQAGYPKFNRLLRARAPTLIIATAWGIFILTDFPFKQIVEKYKNAESYRKKCAGQKDSWQIDPSISPIHINTNISIKKS